MSNTLYLSFEALGRPGLTWPEYSQAALRAVMIWSFAIAAAFIVLLGWSAVLYRKLKGQRTDVRPMVVSQIGLVLVIMGSFNLVVYKRWWLTIVGIGVATIMIPVALKWRGSANKTG